MSRKLRGRAAAQRALDAEYNSVTVDRLVAVVETAVASGRGVVTYPRRGRPSLTGTQAPSPTLGFRISPELKESAERVANREGVSVSELARRALETYVRKAG